MSPELLPFPTPVVMALQAMPAGVTLRAAVDSDVAFLRALYADARSAELAGVPLPAAVREQFLDDQFTLQHRHYVTYFASASFAIVERDGVPIGRLYTDASGSDLHLIDISLATTAQGQGVGTALLKALAQQARHEGRALALKVSRHNVGAARLYDRLGFVYEPMPGDSAYRTMRLIS